MKSNGLQLISLVMVIVSSKIYYDFDDLIYFYTFVRYFDPRYRNQPSEDTTVVKQYGQQVKINVSITIVF